MTDLPRTHRCINDGGDGWECEGCHGNGFKHQEPAPTPSPRPDPGLPPYAYAASPKPYRGEDGEAVSAQAGLREAAPPGSGDGDLTDPLWVPLSLRGDPVMAEWYTRTQRFVEGLYADATAARAEVERLRGALRDLLPLVDDNGEFRKMRVPEIVRRVDAALAALAASTPDPASGIRGVLVAEGPLPSEWPEGTAMRVTVEEPASPGPSVGGPGDGGEEVDR